MGLLAFAINAYASGPTSVMIGIDNTGSTDPLSVTQYYWNCSLSSGFPMTIASNSEISFSANVNFSVTTCPHGGVVVYPDDVYFSMTFTNQSKGESCKINGTGKWDSWGETIYWDTVTSEPGDPCTVRHLTPAGNIPEYIVKLN